MKLTGSQIFVEVLVEQGVDTLFGYPGGAVLNLYDELYKNSDRIRHVLTAHEQGASHAADGYARATGRTGVVLATSGPGATNLVTGIATAYMDSVPMVAFTGNVATTLLGKDSFQEAYIEGITMPITKHNYTVRRVEDLADTMRAAFRIAQSGRKGPVLVDIPKDITAASCEFTPKAPELIRTVTRYNEEDVKKAAQMINESERPIVYFGGGVRSAAGCQPLRDLLEKTGMPATYTLMAAGVLSYGEPHNLGLLGMHGCYAANKAIDEADLVIAVGTRFSDRVALNPDSFAKRAKIIQIDIDPSELGKNVDVDLSLTGDASYILQAILPYVEKTEHKLWMEQIRGWQKNDYKPVDSDTELKPHQIIDEICNQAGPEAVYVTDVGQHQMWAAQYLHHTKSRGFLTSGGLGTMGFGYGAAIGAQMALGRDARVVMLTGDRVETAQAIGARAGVDEVIAGVLPDGKEEVVRLFSQDGHVMMVGDGINDAPALTRADVGVAIGAGTDIAIDAADVVLVNSRLTDVAAAIRLSRRTLRNIHENLFWAFFYNVIGIPLAAGVWIPIFGWTLNPMFGAFAMSLSSFCVVSNALRLNLFKVKDAKKDKKLKSEVSVSELSLTQTDGETKTLKIKGMMCGHCEARVKQALESLEGVEEAKVSHEAGTAVVILSAPVDEKLMKQNVEKEGYKVLSIK